jgi:hypothetical protein
MDIVLVKSADKVVVLAVKCEFMYSLHMVTRNNLVHREREALLIEDEVKEESSNNACSII